MNDEGMLWLRCIDASGKPVFELSSTSLISLYAFVMAHLHFRECKASGVCPEYDQLQVQWEYYHYLKDEDNGVCAKWKVLEAESQKKLFVGIIRRCPRTSDADFSVSSRHGVFTSRPFLSFADDIHRKLFEFSDGDIDLARSMMLFSIQKKEHPFWEGLEQ